MVDDPAHLALVESAAPARARVRVAIDIDAGLRMGAVARRAEALPVVRRRRRSISFAQDVIERGFSLVGVMTYEGQVAGVPDDVPAPAARSPSSCASSSRPPSPSSRSVGPQIAAAAARPRRAGVLERRRLRQRRVDRRRPGRHRGGRRVGAAGARACSTTTAASSRGPRRSSASRSYAAPPKASSPSPAVVSSRSGPPARTALPLPWAPPDLQPDRARGRRRGADPADGHAARSLLQIGDWVWFRHAKSGELAEHTNAVHLLAGDAIVETVPSYRGLGLAW